MARKKKKSILPIIITVISLVLFVIVCIIGLGIYNHISNKDGESRVPNDIAEKDVENRYLTIINDTEQIINEVHIYVGEGTEIAHGYQHNPDEQSFSVQIPNSYDEYNEFIVVLIDRYGLKYEKQVDDVSQTGRTEVKIDANDNVKQKGDWKRNLDKWFNND